VTGSAGDERVRAVLGRGGSEFPGRVPAAGQHPHLCLVHRVRTCGNPVLRAALPEGGAMTPPGHVGAARWGHRVGDEGSQRAWASPAARWQRRDTRLVGHDRVSARDDEPPDTKISLLVGDLPGHLRGLVRAVADRAEMMAATASAPVIALRTATRSRPSPSTTAAGADGVPEDGVVRASGRRVTAVMSWPRPRRGARCGRVGQSPTPTAAGSAFGPGRRGRGRVGERAGSDFSTFCLIFPLRPQ
jgi:hypothetical protein